MDSSTQTLVVITSVVLVIFLVLFSIALFYVIMTLRRVKKIVDRAESVAGSVEAAASACPIS